MKCDYCNENYEKTGLGAHKKTCQRVQELKEEILDMYLNKFNGIHTISSKFKLGKDIIRKIIGNNLRTIGESTKIRHSLYPEKFKLSKETKDKLRVARLKYMRDNPEKTSWRKSNSSFIESYFLEKIKELEWDKIYAIELEKSFYPYYVDFAFINEYVAVELDGSQHQLPDRVENDMKKDNLLISMGWSVFRIKESQIRNDIYGCIDELKSFLDSKSKIGSYRPMIIEYKKKEKRCKDCNCKITIVSTRCSKCDQFRQRKVKRPPYHKLLEDIKSLGYVGTGKLYGVSDNAIRKWKRMYQKYGENF